MCVSIPEIKRILSLDEEVSPLETPRLNGALHIDLMTQHFAAIQSKMYTQVVHAARAAGRELEPDLHLLRWSSSWGEKKTLSDFMLSDSSVPSQRNYELLLFSVCVPLPLTCLRCLRRCICVIKYSASNKTVTVFHVSRKHTPAHTRFSIERVGASCQPPHIRLNTFLRCQFHSGDVKNSCHKVKTFWIKLNPAPLRNWMKMNVWLIWSSQHVFPHSQRAGWRRCTLHGGWHRVVDKNEEECVASA